MYLNVPHLAATYLRSDIFNHLNVSLVIFCYYFVLTEIFVLHFLTTRNNINKKQHGVSKLGFISYDYVLMNRILQATISAWRELKKFEFKVHQSHCNSQAHWIPVHHQYCNICFQTWYLKVAILPFSFRSERYRSVADAYWKVLSNKSESKGSCVAGTQLSELLKYQNHLE